MSELSEESQADGGLLPLQQSGNHREVTDFHAVCENWKEKLIFLLETQKLQNMQPQLNSE